MMASVTIVPDFNDESDLSKDEQPKAKRQRGQNREWEQVKFFEEHKQAEIYVSSKAVYSLFQNSVAVTLFTSLLPKKI